MPPESRTPTSRAHGLGRTCERLAAAHLERHGWSVLERNVRVDRKEIDLIARRGDVVAFVEVKGRSGPGFGHPLEAITWKKRREIAHVARGWIARNGLHGCRYRFDAVGVEIGPDGRVSIEHVADAWRL